MATTARLLILIVNYRNADEIVTFLKNARNLQGFPSVDVTIVDNASEDASSSKISAAISSGDNIYLFRSSKNRGYFGAASWGLQEYLGAGRRLPDWVIVCNHDISIPDRDFLLQLFRYDPMAMGALAPRIQAMPAGVDQNPFLPHRLGKWHWMSLRLISSFYGLAAVWDWLSRYKRVWENYSRRTRNPEAPCTIYAAHGSFFILSRKYFESGGYLDSNLFLFGEEISVAEICRSLGLAIIYEPSLRVLHNEHTSTGKRLNRFTYECQQSALRYLNQRYFSRTQSETGFLSA